MPPVPKPKRIRKRHFLKEWRKHCNLTQEVAADRIGITQGVLSRIERGEVPYDQDFLETAAEAYGTSSASLIMRNPEIDGIWSIQDQLEKADPIKQAEIIEVVKVLLARTG